MKNILRLVLHQIGFTVYTQDNESELKTSRFGDVSRDVDSPMWELWIRKRLNPDSFAV